MAEGGGIGVGVIIGEPTGFSFKVWVSETQAFDLAVGYSFAGEQPFTYLHVDYLRHGLIYYGLEVRFKQLASGLQSGVRIPFGLNAVMFPFELFAEVAPIVNVAPMTSLGLSGGLGARLYF